MMCHPEVMLSAKPQLTASVSRELCHDLLALFWLDVICSWKDCSKMPVHVIHWKARND